MPIKPDNLNLNLNLNLGASLGGGGGGATGYGRPRFNTEDMDKLVEAKPTVKAPPLKPYSADWDPELRTWPYVYEFMTAINWGAGLTPITYLQAQINSQNGFPVPDAGATLPLNQTRLSDQVLGVANAALDRADRAMEILDQATAVGALNYWTGLMRIDPSQEKSAFLLMLVARKIGEYVAMGLKDVYKMRRPSQVYGQILPIIDPPDTPSFPSSHSLQAHLISGMLKLCVGSVTGGALDVIADRVARNREIAGVHYAMDSDAGTYAAQKCLDKLSALGNSSLYKTLLALAGGELSDLQ